ncbi:hypothetical protein BDD12DRAFT_870389, partial [Trichophaea hybrida]
RRHNELHVGCQSLRSDVHIYSANGSATTLEAHPHNGVTNSNFHSMKDDYPLQPGNYYIVTNGSITVNNEPWLVLFRDAVRERDRRCVITGKPALRADHGIWRGFEAAHIFPLAYERHWNKENYGHWITIPPATESTATINSVQNGMLLDSSIHALSMAMIYRSIQMYDNYKIVCFGPDGKGIAGKHLDQQLLQDPHRPVDQLLRWHFRQAVLANMRRAGEPVFEIDFPPGSDMIGEIMGGPSAAERMEFELFSRLAV